MRKRILWVFLAAAIVFAGYSIHDPVEACAYSGCGMRPMKPMIPMGCRDLVAVCTCDERGQNCRWEWVCR